MSTKHLTAAENNVLSALCTGKSNAEIGKEIGICTRTVKTHLYRIYKKIDVKNSRMAIVKTLKV